MNDETREISTEVKSDPFLEMVERVSANPDVDADKLQKLLDMNMQVRDRQARDAFYDAMNRVQMQLPSIAKLAENPQTQSRYATLEHIVRQVRPIYTKEGFSTSFTEAPKLIDTNTGKRVEDDEIAVIGTLRHRDGHSEQYTVTMPLDLVGIKGNPNKTRVHATGSTFTYARRYLTCLMFDIATGDDLDGNMPDAFLSEEQQDQIAEALVGLHPDDIASFWRKARHEPGEYDQLLAHRWPAYQDWFLSKGIALEAS